jgi:C1A family cysteine protease
MARKLIHGLGWKKDREDSRDFRYAAPREVVTSLPSMVDLREKPMPAVYDQGDLGSCTANAIAGAIAFEHLKENLPDPVPSRLFIYYNERVMEGTVAEDAGAELRDGIKSVVNQGVCPEPEWPYMVEAFATKPSDDCYENALKDLVLQYQRVDNTSLEQMKSCLAEGFPFVFGITVYSNFPMTTISGSVPMPTCLSKTDGGHAMMVVGYHDSINRFIFRNSWGEGWGASGYGTIPYKYLTNPNLCGDCWTIRSVQ